MPPIKIYFLSAEVSPFSETYSLASFSRKLTSRIHEKTDVDIIDISGSVIKHIAGYTSGESIDVSTLNSGVYIVRVQTEDAIANLRFIKK